MKNKILLSFLVLFLSCLTRFSDVNAQINTPSGVVPFGANLSYGFGIMPTNLPTGGGYGQSQDAANAYNTWKSNYVVSCGGSPNQYRVKFDDINKTVSEGVAYGMLLAAYASDKDLFDGLWSYYRANRNGNNIMNWRIAGCSGVDGSNGATDAEFDAAMALLIAENQWPLLNSPYDYSAEATTLITAIKNNEMDGSSYQARNGDGWNPSLDCRNPSYQAPAYYKAFGAQIPAQASFWTNAVTGGYNLVTANAHATTGLVSDWCTSAGVKNLCNGGYDGFGYDACRNPWRMAVDAIWNNDATGKAQCNKITNYTKGVGASAVGGPRNMDGTGGGGHSATFISMYATAVMGTTATNQTFMNQMYSETVSVSDVYQTSYPSGYFGNTLRVISLFMMSGNFWKPGTSLNQEINIKATATSTNIPSAGTYDFQNVISSGNKVVTFTIENQGQLALNLTGTPIVSVSGANAAQFVVTTQPSAASIAAGSSLTFVVTFTPGSTGSKTAQLSIASNDANENPYTINLTGTGTSGATSPEIDLAQQGSPLASNSTFTWTATTQNATSYTTFTINNTGTAPLNITSTVVSAGQGYSLSSSPVSSIAGGGSGTFVVKFNPTSTGTKTGTITISNDDSDEGTYVINLTGTSQTCSASITSSEVIQDYDANNNVVKAYSPVGPLNENVANPYSGGLNTSPTVASYTRLNSGTYDGIRYSTTCGINFPFTGKTIISMMVYSPAVGVPVLMSLKNSVPASVKDITVYTRTSGQWEKLYFDYTSIAGNTTVKYMDIFFHPTVAPASSQTFYIDNIKYDVNPCTAGIPATNVLMDYDQNVYLSTVFGPVNGMNEAFTNPFPGGLNTSTLVNKIVRTTTQDYDIFRYSACGSYFDLSPGKQKMTMLIYTANVGDTVIMSLKTAGGVTVNDATAVTTTSNAWELLTFDHSAVVNNTTAALMDIMLDPKRHFVANATQQTYYVDNIRYSLPAPEIDVKTSGGTAYAKGSTYAFGAATLGSPVSVTFLVQNNGTGTLNLSGTPKVSISGANAADFVIDQTITTSTVSPLSSTTFVITFNPSAVGAKTAVISIANDDSNENPYTINLTGTGNGPEINVKVGVTNYATASTYDFGGSNVGTAVGPVTFTVENTGNAVLNLSGTPKVAISGSNAADFTITQTSTTATVAVAGTTTFTISFNPSANGTRLASISIANSDADENPYVINLTGTGVAPEINVKAASTSVASGGSYDFGSSNVGTATSATTFTIENLGSSNLSLSGTPKVAISGTNQADFTIVQTGVSSPVAAAGSTTFTITFNPGGTGARSAAITIANNDADESSYVINLTGTGTAPEINVKAAATSVASGASYDFGNSNVGTTTAATTFTIENNGTANLNLTGTPKVAISGTNAADFTIVQTGISSPVTISGTTTFTITFTPGASGSRTAAITISNNDSDESNYVINLTGTGTAPEINVKAAAASVASGGSYDFGSIVSGSSGSAVTFTIENLGNINLTLTGTPKVSIAGANMGDFTIVQTGVTSPVAGAGTTTFTITFSPAAVGSRAAAITIANNDSDEGSYVINLTGTGTASPVPEINVKAAASNVASGGSYDFGNSPAGTATSATTFTIENIGTASLALSGSPKISIAGANASDFTIVQTGVTATVSASGTTTFTITFNPSATGARAAAITILNTDSDEGSYVINLTGTGTVALPVTQTITGASTVSPNQTGVTYSVPPPVSGSSYSWSLPPGAVITSASSDSSSVTVTFGTSGGTVSVTETNASGSATSSKTVTMSGATGISTGLSSDTYLNYPSPFTEETTVKINASVTAPLSVRISDVKGNYVYESDGYFTNEDISLGRDLDSGVYMVQISYGSKIQIIRIVKL